MMRIVFAAAAMAFVFFAASARADDQQYRPTVEESSRSVDAFLAASGGENCSVTVVPKWQWPSFSLSTSYVSNYVVALGYGNGEAVQLDLTATWPSGWYLDLWGSTGTNDWSLNSDFADEGDLEVGKLWKYGGLDVKAGLSYFALYDLRQTTGDKIRPFVQAAKDFVVCDSLTLTPSVKLETLLNVPDLSPRWLATAGLAAAFKLNEWTTLGASLTAAYDGGTCSADSGWIFQVKVGPTFQLNKTTSLEMFYEHVQLEGLNDGRLGNSNSADLVGLSVSFNF